ncbi:MAG: arsenate reductase [Flavobacteriales bacterium]|nr:arsenate reductase [Flavobacteriales bacterium]
MAKKKIILLNSCSTCVKISNELGVDDSWEIQNIKENNIDGSTLELLRKELGSYEEVFSKRAMKYKSMGIKDKVKKDEDYKPLILEEYTFLKRPVVLIDDRVFVGNSKNTVAEAKAYLESKS